MLLGGAAIGSSTEDSAPWDATLSPQTPLEAVSEARRLVGLSEDRLTLEEQLALMGQRVNSIRTSKNMTQRELAEASGLDRTYISLVEHGRQNLTIGAVLKVAHALDVPIGDLLR